MQQFVNDKKDREKENRDYAFYTDEDTRHHGKLQEHVDAEK